MSKHPLTDEILGRQFDGIETSSFHQTPPASIHDYLTVEQSQWLFDEQDMRAAADWQLEQCIAWLDDTDCDDPQETATRLRQAMRPQEDN